MTGLTGQVARKIGTQRRHPGRIRIAFKSAVLASRFDPLTTKKWLLDGVMSLRTSQTNLSARFNWEDGSTRVDIGFVDKGPAKSTVAVAHEKLPGPDEAETAKSAWRQRLVTLKSFLEA